MTTFKKVSTVPGDNYTPGSIIDYEYSKDYFTMIAIDLGKQENKKHLMLIEMQYNN